MKYSQYLLSFFMGYFIYSLVEILNRGYTHWTMSLTGGFILSVLYGINSRRSMDLLKSCFIGSLVITAVEFAVGVFDNLIMHWNVWDYSSMPLNLLGQICLPFSCCWFLICIPAYYLCGIMRKRFTGMSVRVPEI